MKNVIHGLCLLTAVSLVACGSSQNDWNQAMSQNTVESYQAFLNKHPNDPHDADARTRIQTLQDNKAWQTAQTTNTVDAYQQYIAAEPNGAHVQEAHDRMMAFQRAAAWNDAKNAGTAQALQDFLQKYPTGAEADQARAQLMQFNYEVSLGTFRSSKQADDARSKLQDKFGKDLQNIVVVPPSGKSKMYTVASAAMTEDQAKSACATLKKAHQRCEVTKRPEQPAQG
jgi:hypothetical protein